MDDRGLQSGDKVVDLAAATRTASVFAGFFAGVTTGWFSQHKIVDAGIAGLGGGVVGYIVARLLGRILCPAPPGKSVVAKLGISSLPLTLKGALPGAFFTSVSVKVVFSLVMANPIMPGMWSSLAVGIVVGIFSASLSSLLR